MPLTKIWKKKIWCDAVITSTHAIDFLCLQTVCGPYREDIQLAALLHLWFTVVLDSPSELHSMTGSISFPANRSTSRCLRAFQTVYLSFSLIKQLNLSVSRNATIKARLQKRARSEGSGSDWSAPPVYPRRRKVSFSRESYSYLSLIIQVNTHNLFVRLGLENLIGASNQLSG